MKIVCIGDSITAAERNAEDPSDLGNGFVKITAAKLKYLLPETEIEVVNKGVNGITVKDLLDRVEEDVIKENPDVVILEGGINDVRRSFDSGEEFDSFAFKNNYEALVKAIKSTGAKLIIIEPFVLKVSADKARYRKHLNFEIEAIEDIGYRVADAIVHLDEIFNGVCEGDPKEARNWAEDGIHPTHRASRHIANIIISKIQNKLIANA